MSVESTREERETTAQRRSPQFRFGLQVGNVSSAAAAAEVGRRAEDLGFDIVLAADHLVDGLLSPFVTLATIASATTTLRVGTLVLNNDFRHPAVVAREAATLDLLSDGRFELGLGAGHAAPEYTEIGVPFDPASVRVDRLIESASVLRRLFDGETVTFAGVHYHLEGHRLFPARRPRLLIGGNGDRLLQCGAQMADVVGFTGLGRTRADGQRHDIDWRPDAIDRKVALVRAAAVGRPEPPEFNALVQHIEITADREAVADRLAAAFDIDRGPLLHAPFVLPGEVGQIVDQLLEARERWGFTYFVTRDPRQTAPVIDALRACA